MGSAAIGGLLGVAVTSRKRKMYIDGAYNPDLEMYITQKDTDLEEMFLDHLAWVIRNTVK